MILSDQWTDYAVLDTGDGEKLERWGEFLLARPDPQVLWPRMRGERWRDAHAHYLRSSDGGGAWETRAKLPERWQIAYEDLRFWVRPTGFKHTGLFPEQAANWEWMRERIRESGHAPRVLNLFGYTGGATLACAAEGAEVVHVDAAKGMVGWARENAELSGLGGRKIRWIIDDAVAFVAREGRRGNRYDGIVMDPPSYGRGPDGSVWKLEREIWPLVKACAELLSERPLFFVLNAYTTGLAPSVLGNLLRMAAGGGDARADEIGLPVEAGGVLPCGATGRWTPTR